MRKVTGIILSVALVCSLAFFVCSGAEEDSRRPAVAGQFYPSSEKELRAAVDGYLKDAMPLSREKPLAIIVPHAGYIYSGQIAADAFNQASEGNYDLVVILGTNHTKAGFDKIGLYPGRAFVTPLGMAPVDTKVVDALVRKDPDHFVRDASVHEKEHSVEVQVPFVQRLFPKAAIVPVVVGTFDVDLCARFGKALAEVLKGHNALVVASSDLSHYPASDDANIVDAETLRAVVKLDPGLVYARAQEMMERNIPNLVTCACGQGAIEAAISEAREMGARRGVVISYANSGDVIIGQEDRSVGYGAVVLTAGTGESDTRVLDGNTGRKLPGAIPLTKEDRRALLELARKTIDRFLTSETLPLVRGLQPRLMVKQGVFVTLTERGNLRGCIGHIGEDMPLGRATSWAALQAAFNDRRFAPLQPSEWQDVEIEISVLTPPKKIEDVGQIKVGRDGVILEKGGSGAVFLPQVAPEQGWSRDEMLDHLCVKAGLKSGCWKKDAVFRAFQAEVFHE
jgi:AmmeMemoRadiSam system protein B/AmmeMemoRadiSam system protein A